MMTLTIKGGCHCGAVRFEAVVRESPVELLDCNCSMCAKTGFLHLIVRHEDFRLIRGEGDLVSYRFGTGTADHLFCRTCGIKSFYQPRSHTDAWSVNFRALNEGHRLETRVTPFDGRSWEEAKLALDRSRPSRGGFVSPPPPPPRTAAAETASRPRA